MSRLLQVIIALVGLTLSGALGWASWNNDQLQTRQGYLMLYTQAIVAAECNETMLQVAQDAAQKLEDMGAGGKYMDHVSALAGSTQNCTTNLASAPDQVAQNMAAPAPEQAAPGGTPAPVTTGEAAGPAISPQVLARAGVQVQNSVPASVAASLVARRDNFEFRRASNEANAPDTGQFYAILASYDVADATTYNPTLGISAQYGQLARTLAGQGVALQVWRTRVSNHFAIVLAPEGLTRDAARDLVTRARSSGWSSDAFVQEKRNWAPCPNPGAIHAETDCSVASAG